VNALVRAWRRAVSILLPWPRKDERRKAVHAARQERLRSEQGAAYAEQVRQDIERMAATNHFAAAIAEQIIDRHRGKQ
jgi:hypothetical protein